MIPSERRPALPTLRQSLRAGKTLTGVFCELGCPAAVEIAGMAGWDFVLLDGEHGPLGAAQFPEQVRAAQAVGAQAVIRVPTNDPAIIQHALDAGAAGVQIPRVESLPEARLAVESARFYPQGRRGFNPFVRAACYAAAPVGEFLEQANEDVLVALQLESAAGVERAAEVGALPGIDVLFIGPFDLSQSLGIPGEVTHPRVYAAGETIIRAASARGVAVGVFSNAEEDARRWLQTGVRYLVFSTDTFLLTQAMRRAARLLS
jgi:4-hydroxy-2-oxoheptanedioate aldolase